MSLGEFDYKKFYITFGRRYEKVTHPIYVGLSTCGYVEVLARNLGDARHFAGSVFNRFYDEVLTEQEMEEIRDLYPCGILKSYHLNYKHRLSRCKPEFDAGEIVKELRMDRIKPVEIIGL